jgi:hypothetical protein
MHHSKRLVKTQMKPMQPNYCMQRNGALRNLLCFTVHRRPLMQWPLYGQDSLGMVAIGGGKILVQEDWRQPHILGKTP